jgi:hypothetical protein
MPRYDPSVRFVPVEPASASEGAEFAVRARFFRALALNRLGRRGDAVEELELAREADPAGLARLAAARAPAFEERDRALFEQ